MWNDIEFWVVSIMLLLKNIWIYQQFQPKRVVLLCISQGPLQMMHFFIYFEGLFLLDGSRSAQLKNNIISTREASETTVSKVKHAHCLIWICLPALSLTQLKALHIKPDVLQWLCFCQQALLHSVALGCVPLCICIV